MVETTEKAICYIRVSTKYQEDQPRHDHQIKSLTAYCEREGWDYEIVAECFSGKTIEKRKILPEVLERMNRGDAKYLLVLTLDRLTRSIEDGLKLRMMSITNGWKIIVPGLDLYDDRYFMVMVTMLGLAEVEIKNISKRVKEGTQRAKEMGKPVGGQRWGIYDSSVVKKVYYYRYKGLTYKQIADKMNEIGIETKCCKKETGKQWNFSKIQGVLSTYRSDGKYKGHVNKMKSK
jgi:DNA invertase Pin-like site-specific DNA recombinase